jgi:hypothetical protein
VMVLVLEEGQSVGPWHYLRAFKTKWNQRKKPPSHEREYTQQSQATLICDRGLGFWIAFISVYRHGRPCNFTVMKMSTNITAGYGYCDDLYGLS